MSHYLVDGTNLSRGGDYDARFPAMEEARASTLLSSLERLARRLGARTEIELFFDGPPRPLAGDGVSVRFSRERSADELIEGKVRLLRREGRGVVVATGDGGLARQAAAEGARVIGYGELMRLCGR